ncbi:NUDIX hydrolase [Nereida ignava]|uniref:NUDIX domain protein n=1 Tax=Nereida ignava TaxID=282199 RepID=A0A0U1NIG5_9RHOB|nr:NUDIX hydrolase [Nereida ignava]CRK74475.1 NUDIX domain protein [Nereida ignava]SFJ20524.1 8-oxo-dGTP pyrophosphatase MutT, NUDIX family [Nereida ignava DSM 16309]
MSGSPSNTPIKDAASIILLRQTDDGQAVLMGQRGAAAAFMPSKFVFPGGAVDKDDYDVEVAQQGQITGARDASDVPPPALAAAAIRELWEETGQILGSVGTWPTDHPPEGWASYAQTGHVPNGTDLRFIFRAITPQGRPRRFDARFFVANADALGTDPDFFDRAQDELSHLRWVPLAEARQLDLPFVTDVVLAEVQRFVTRKVWPAYPMFMDNTDDRNIVRPLIDPIT